MPVRSVATSARSAPRTSTRKGRWNTASPGPTTPISRSELGGGGADTLDATWGAGRTFVFGDAGDDLFLLDAGKDLLTEDAAGGTDTVHALIPGGGIALPPFIEVLVMLGTTSWGRGNGEANLVTGTPGANLLRGGGADTLEGGAGDGTL